MNTSKILFVWKTFRGLKILIGSISFDFFPIKNIDFSSFRNHILPDYTRPKSSYHYALSKFDHIQVALIVSYSICSIILLLRPRLNSIFFRLSKCVWHRIIIIILWCNWKVSPFIIMWSLELYKWFHIFQVRLYLCLRNIFKLSVCTFGNTSVSGTGQLS